MFLQATPRIMPSVFPRRCSLDWLAVLLALDAGGRSS